MDKDRVTYRWASITLRVGMYSSFGVMLAGLLWTIIGGTTPAQANRPAVSLDRLYDRLLAGDPHAVLSLGLLLLLASPGVTLLASMVTFATARNWRFAGLAAVTATILLLSVALALK